MIIMQIPRTFITKIVHFIIKRDLKKKIEKLKKKMPSIIQSEFLNKGILCNVLFSFFVLIFCIKVGSPLDAVEYCRELDNDVDIHATICEQMDIMLICAYIELILPFFTIVGSFFFKDDGPHVWGSNLPGLGSITAGSIYLALYYGSKYIFNNLK